MNIVRGIPIWGRATSDHCEIVHDNVRVPLDNQLGKTGSDHQATQDRLGAGRIYHCMNSIGQMWRAFDLKVQRTATRKVHVGVLEEKPFIQGFIAESYIDIQAARPMTIHAAERIDAEGDARTLRLADGPDEVHKILIAKNVLQRYHQSAGWDFGN